MCSTGDNRPAGRSAAGLRRSGETDRCACGWWGVEGGSVSDTDRRDVSVEMELPLRAAAAEMPGDK